MKYSEVRIRLARIMKPIITDKLCDIYQNNYAKYPQNGIEVMMTALSYETKQFVNNILKIPPEKLDKFYSETNPKIIVCFYLRYWLVINYLKESPESELNLLGDDKDFLLSLLFDFSEALRIVY